MLSCDRHAALRQQHACIQGAVELCEWMFEHGTNPQLQNISSAVYDSPTEDQIYQTQQYVPACSSAPSAALVYPQSGSSAGKVFLSLLNNQCHSLLLCAENT